MRKQDNKVILRAYWLQVGFNQANNSFKIRFKASLSSPRAIVIRNFFQVGPRWHFNKVKICPALAIFTSHSRRYPQKQSTENDQELEAGSQKLLKVNKV